ncbi:MAG: glycosyltransferase family 4 protein [Lentisphaeria bacterium]|nr:glycosyltransferase family 4 protein [Lentisphaeria bacterium]
MKVAIGIFVYFPYGGLQSDMKKIAAELASRGADVTVYTGAWRDTERPAGIRVVELDVSGASSHVRAVDFARKFRRAAADADVRIAFNRFGGCEFYFAGDDCYGAELARRRGGFLLKHLPRYRTFSALEKEIFSPASATKILYIAPRQCEEFRAVYGTQKERFFLLPPGIGEEFVPPDAARRRECRDGLGIADGEFSALFVAAQWQLKGGDRILAAFSRLPEEIRKRLRLDFVGSAPGSARRLAERYGVSDRCRFHGVQPRAEEFYQAADVLLHPARKEAAGNVISEALGCGIPVISAGVCGFSSLVRKSGAGIVLEEPFDPDSFVRACGEWFARREEFSALALRAASTLHLRGRAAAAAEISLGSVPERRA